MVQAGEQPIETVHQRIEPLSTRQSLTDDAYEVLKGLVMDGVIAPGERLRIDQLARDLQVSSTPIREALVRLESEGLAEKAALRGYTAAAMLTADQIAELYEFRHLIEPWAAARAAQQRNEAGLLRLQAELRSVADLPSGDSYEAYRELVGHDDRFHQLITELAGNTQVRQAFVRTHCHLRLFRAHYANREAAETIREHRQIAEAIEAGSPSTARSAMSHHLRQARRRLDSQ